MIQYTKGNLLEVDAEALVNTVNTVGVMGKGIALMFKEAFPDNFKRYVAACKAGEVELGKMFVSQRQELLGPKWIINFPTKMHWRHPSKMAWISDGLDDLVRLIQEEQIKSLAIPPLGSGNGGLEWTEVRELIEAKLADLRNVDILVFEPTGQYQNVTKKSGVKNLTPARALIAELVRRYWVLGIECSLLEIQKLAWFLERNIVRLNAENTLDLRFQANRYGPYSNRLNHLLNALDGSYLHCNKRISDAGPTDVIWFDDSKRDYVTAYLNGPEAKPYKEALEATTVLIDGFESPLGMEVLATVDWLLWREQAAATIEGIRRTLQGWPGGAHTAERKQRLFDDRLLRLALQRLAA